MPEHLAEERQRAEVRAELHAIVDRLVDGWEPIQRMAKFMGTGFPSSSRLGEGGRGAHSDPTCDQVANHFDGGPAEYAADWLRGMRDFIHVARGLDGRRSRLEVPVESKAKSVEAGGLCDACKRWVAGTPVDRLRSGYCDTDYRAWIRAGRPERIAFNAARRRELDEQAG